jgi:hypothetical protein
LKAPSLSAASLVVALSGLDGTYHSALVEGIWRSRCGGLGLSQWQHRFLFG